MRSRYLAPVLIAAVMFFALANALVQGVFFVSGRQRQFGLYPLFDLGGEWNAPALYSGWVVFTVAMVMASVGWRLLRTHAQGWGSWLFLAVVFAYIACDEVFSLHERLSGAVDEVVQTPFAFSWVVPGMLFVVVVFLLSLGFLRRLDARSRRYVLIAGGVYVLGAVGLEILEGWRWRYVENLLTDPLNIVLYSIEETMEMSGMSLMLYAMLRRAELMFDPPGGGGPSPEQGRP